MEPRSTCPVRHVAEFALHRHIPVRLQRDKLPPPPLPMDTRPLPPHHAPPREEDPPCRCPTNRLRRPPASCRTAAAAARRWRAFPTTAIRRPPRTATRSRRR